MTLRQRALPIMIAAALAAPSAFAQSAQRADADKEQADKKAAARAEAKADADKARTADRKPDPRTPRKDARAVDEQPDEPEEDDR